MITREQLQTRRSELEANQTALTKELEQLAGMRESATSQLHAVTGAIAIIDEMLQILVDPSAEP